VEFQGEGPALDKTTRSSNLADVVDNVVVLWWHVSLAACLSVCLCVCTSLYTPLCVSLCVCVGVCVIVKRFAVTTLPVNRSRLMANISISGDIGISVCLSANSLFVHNLDVGDSAGTIQIILISSLINPRRRRWTIAYGMPRRWFYSARPSAIHSRTRRAIFVFVRPSVRHTLVRVKTAKDVEISFTKGQSLPIILSFL